MHNKKFRYNMGESVFPKERATEAVETRGLHSKGTERRHTGNCP
jgi:hypothetical protein